MRNGLVHPVVQEHVAQALENVLSKYMNTTVLIPRCLNAYCLNTLIINITLSKYLGQFVSVENSTFGHIDQEHVAQTAVEVLLYEDLYGKKVSKKIKLLEKKFPTKKKLSENSPDT